MKKKKITPYTDYKEIKKLLKLLPKKKAPDELWKKIKKEIELF